MESSPTSSPTNSVDKPDELVSTSDVIRQIHANQQSAEHQIAQSATIQPQQILQSQQKKCLHHRIFDINTSNLVNERVAALLQQQQQQLQQTQQIYHQIQSQSHLPPQQQQLPPRPSIPMQQIPQSHILRNSYQQQIQQQAAYPLQQTSASPIAGNSSNVQAVNTATTPNYTIAGNSAPTIVMNSSNVGSGSVVGSNANANSSTNANSTNANSAIHSQNGLVQQMNAALLAERYLLLDLVEGSTLYKCIDVKTHEELVCKVIIHTHAHSPSIIDTLCNYFIQHFFFFSSLLLDCSVLMS